MRKLSVLSFITLDAVMNLPGESEKMTAAASRLGSFELTGQVKDRVGISLVR